MQVIGRQLVSAHSGSCDPSRMMRMNKNHVSGAPTISAATPITNCPIAMPMPKTSMLGHQHTSRDSGPQRMIERCALLPGHRSQQPVLDAGAADLDLVTGSVRAALMRAGLAGPDVTVEAVNSLPRHPETGKLRRVISA
jgi:hypothetical protein